MCLYLKALWKLYKYRFVVRIDPPATQHKKSIIKPNCSLCTLFTHVASIHSIYPQVYNHEKQILIQSNRNKPRAQTGDRTKNLARHTKIWLQKTLGLGFPGGAVVESLPANAGDAGSSPGLGGSHVPRSGWAREPQLLSLRVWSLCSATGGAAMVRGPRTAMKSGPRLPQLEKALAQKRRPNTAKNK